eukprot:TRINITY_DN107700_c0_g1_i1.p1 TRINITY_DN107700_c0_g1~~TRINITY_DN107700_c0_g1_i1.p1  ORF type:complete len:460 (+),score=74.79 TRINITY_DN107700_c0_g1_i1:65-1444(+)
MELLRHGSLSTITGHLSPGTALDAVYDDTRALLCLRACCAAMRTWCSVNRGGKPMTFFARLERGLEACQGDIRLLSVDLTSERLHQSPGSFLETLSARRIFELRIRFSKGVLKSQWETCRQILCHILDHSAPSLRHLHLRLAPNPAWLLLQLCRESDLTLSGSLDGDRNLQNISDAMVLADLHLKLTRNLGKEPLLMKLLKVVHERLNAEQAAPLFSGVSIVAELLGCEASLQQELRNLHLLDPTAGSKAPPGAAKGFSLDAYETVRFTHEDVSVPKIAWHKWRLSFAYLVVCRPLVLTGPGQEEQPPVVEDRSDTVRRVLCQHGSHHNLDPRTAYSNTSWRERAFASKYMSGAQQAETWAGATAYFDFFAGHGPRELPRELLVHCEGVQEEMARWTGADFAARFRRTAQQERCLRNRHLQAFSLFYEGRASDLDMEFIRAAPERYNGISDISLPDAWD